MKSFTVENVLTWGLQHNKEFGGFNLPVSFVKEPAIEKEIQKLVKRHNVKQIFYGDSKTIYFRLWHLTENQQKDLLNTGRQYIDLQFEIEDQPKESKNGTSYLRLNITGLRKSKISLDLTPKEDF